MMRSLLPAFCVALLWMDDARGLEKTLICHHPSAKMYSVFEIDYEQTNSGIVGTAEGTLDDIGNMPGTLGAPVGYAVNGNSKRFVLTNLRTHYKTVIDRLTGLGRTAFGTDGERLIRCMEKKKEF